MGDYYSEWKGYQSQFRKNMKDLSEEETRQISNQRSRFFGMKVLPNT